jgi:small subunit ribosomal protein S20
LANIKSQKKRILTNEKARIRNRAVKSELKTYTKKLDEQISSNHETDEVRKALIATTRKLDKAVSKGVLHKSNANNKKSALAKKVNTFLSASTVSDSDDK